ncbi:MAG: DNA mismatch repair endonuclease MutL [Candidatus Riflebacteria bacterium]|nr:DNA mismatch repair endonuclease MutL [Candidatus Riflebacteria bacterium]
MQNTKIRVLDDDVICRIAAGEVVERPSSVVKELIENSIDAKASRIEVEIKDGGQKLIEVTDNGEGMTRADAVLAFTPHATSKIYSDEQLENIITLGFRGEALPTIAAVSRVSLFTKHNSEETGTRVNIDGGVMSSVESDAFPGGTRIQIKNLFYNTPARRKFLKSVQSEMAQISDIVCHYMMGYPEIAFKFTKSNVAIASTNGSGNLSDSVLAIYGPEVTKGLIPLKEPSSIAGTGMSLRGYISPPNQARPSSRYMTTLINRRVVKTKLLVQAINKACSAFFPKGKYPVLILDLRIPPDMIDVNVHPQKTEIRFKDEHWIFGLIWETVKTSLSGLKMIADIEPTIEKKESQGDFSQIQSSGIFSAMTPKLVNIPSLTGTIPSNNFDADRAYVVGEEKLVSDIAPETVKNNAKNPLSPVMQLSKPKILAQLKNTYLLGEDDEGLFIIDQHVAHERVLFDQYLQTYKDTSITTQTLLFPVPLKLLPSERLIIRDHLDDMKSLGFSIYQEEDGQFYITAIPVSDKKSDQKNIQDILSQVLNGWESRTLDEIKVELLKSMACKAAVKAGDPLSSSEWNSLLAQLLKTENPFTCPHGRPIVVRLSVRQIETGFLRT